MNINFALFGIGLEKKIIFNLRKNISSRAIRNGGKSKSTPGVI